MKSLLIFLFIFSLNLAHSQLSEKPFHLEAKYLGGNVDTSIYNGGSIGFEWRFHEYFGVNYNFDLLYKSNNLRHFHTTMGVIGGPMLIAAGFSNLFSADSTDITGFGIIGGILLLVLPDGVNFHLPLGYKWDISAYANVLGVDFIKDRKSSEKWIKYACSFGAKGVYSINENVTANIFIETRKTAGYRWGIGGGAGLGIAFGDR